MKKIIMFTGGIETQEYFTLQLARAFKNMGHTLMLYRLDKGDLDFPAMCRFIDVDNTVMVTFNFHGLNNEEPFCNDGLFIWELLKIPCFNIVLDHPFYYHKFLEIVPPLYVHISIDRGHENYMKRFFPEIKLGAFLPLAGTGITKTPVPERTTDIVFTGNYTPPNEFEKHITRINDDYTRFYYGIIDDLIAHPSQAMEEVFEKHLIREMSGLSDDDLKKCMENMIFIDLYIRFYFRGKVVQTLADNGFPVHVYGGGWELLTCQKPDNIILCRPQDSYGCLEAIRKSKISLNVMPWFKDGAHDRIFNSMLNGALCLSDDSIWLKENLTNGKEIVYYSLTQIEQLPSIVGGLLSDSVELETIARNGYQIAKAYHTWANRAEELDSILQ